MNVHEGRRRARPLRDPPMAATQSLETQSPECGHRYLGRPSFAKGQLRGALPVRVCVWLAAEGYVERVRQLWGHVSGAVGRVDCVSEHDGLQFGPYSDSIDRVSTAESFRWRPPSLGARSWC